MHRIFDSIELDLLAALRATLETWASVPSGLLGDLEKPKFIHLGAREGDGNGGKAKSYISIYGQAPNYTIGRLTRMNKLVPSPVGGLSS